MSYVKFTRKGGAAIADPLFLWPLPTKKKGIWTPGEWVEVEGPIKVCVRGLHAADPNEVLSEWINFEAYELEYEGEILESLFGTEEAKVVGSKARLVSKYEGWDIKRFVLDCAENVLPEYQKSYPVDKRTPVCIHLTKKYLDGKIGMEELIRAKSGVYSFGSHAADVALFAHIGNSSIGWYASCAIHMARLSVMGDYERHNSVAAQWQERRIREYLGIKTT